MTGVLLALAAATIAALASAAPAWATYAAQFSDQCCYMTLEQGDKAEQFLAFKNTGDQIWYRDGAIPVRLGASNPMDRSSPFFTADDWVSAGRPTGLDTATTDPGQVGRFTWITTAPAQVGTYREFYMPLAEGQTWMDPGLLVYLDYTVIAAQAPTVRITASPARVARGESFGVSIDATDNRAVARVTFAVGSQVVTATAPTQGTSGYSATLSSAELGAGTQSVTIAAYDPGGRTSTATTSFEVFEPPAPPPPPPPPPPVSTRLASFTPLFATRSGRGRRVGTLEGIGSVVGLRPFTRLRLVCVHRCVRPTSTSRRASSSGRVRITLKRPLRLLRTTLIELRASLSGYVTRFQRYRFRATKNGTFARFVSAGCLAREKPRTVVRCPPA